MPPRSKKADALPSTMKELKDTLWKAADKLRGSMDASQYKDVILGLVFLKYVSDAFDERRQQIADELAADGWDEAQITGQLDDIDEYTGNGVFYVNKHARWSYLAQHAKGLPAAMAQPFKPIGELVDDAMDLVMGANPSLAGTLPRIYNRDNVDQRRLGELLDLFNSARFTGQGATKARDLLGEVYEYFLEKFAKAEGKRGGEFYTPAGVVRVLVEVLEPTHGRVYDPCCGSGGMFVQTEKFLEAHSREGSDIAVYGQELNERTWRMAKMNLAIHGLESKGLSSRWGDTFAHDNHPDLSGKNGADYVLANPPFNIKDWVRRTDDPRWKYGVPPAGNANYAWIQHILSKLAPGGSAGVVMANGSMSSNSGGEGGIRAQIVEADLVSCMVALPTQLFRSTGIPVCLWFFAKDKTKGARGSVDRSGQVLFIDARSLGFLVDRAERALSDDDIARIADTFHAWRGTASVADRAYEDVAGFCRSATLEELKANDYALTPDSFVGAVRSDYTADQGGAMVERLRVDLLDHLGQSGPSSQHLSQQLMRVVVAEDYAPAPSVTLGSLVERGAITLGDGYRTRRAEHGQPGMRILRAGDVRDGHIAPAGEEFVSFEFARQIGPKASQPGDIVLTTKGTVGRAAVVPTSSEQVVYSPQLCYFRVLNEDLIDRDYLASWFLSPSLRAQAARLMHRSDMAPYINLQDIRSLRLPLPPIEEQRRLGQVSSALSHRLDSLAAERRNLMELREVLAAGLISGRLRVQDAEPVVGEPV